MTNFDVTLKGYQRTYRHRRGLAVRALWRAVSLLLFESGWFPSSAAKRVLLRCFGAKVGGGVVVKPRVRIKFPWLLRIGEDCWIGEDAWIDNLAEVELGNNVCLSQGAYLCTGTHDPDSPTFDLRIQPIYLHDGAWIAAKATVLGGVTVRRCGLVAVGGVATRDVPEATIVGGVPARKLRARGAMPRNEETKKRIE